MDHKPIFYTALTGVFEGIFQLRCCVKKIQEFQGSLKGGNLYRVAQKERMFLKWVVHQSAMSRCYAIFCVHNFEV